ncbi:glycoside hydrolase family 3 N-terminal domain-containing protein [Geodermatophilus sp. CPCC 205761]|uniref:glycoside hydrolase family 3 N-terminal domain-containing protein n=1 Tax=Geodermatophilus sp. CPCC 205761 TaxID=2936597 RepID=UPI003EEBACC5
MQPLRSRSFAAGILLSLVLGACSSGEPESTGTASTGPTTAEPKPTPDPLHQRVDAALARLDRRRQVAQLIVAGVPLSDLSPADALVRDLGAGGIFLAGRSTVPAGELAATTARWTEAAGSGPRPWVAVDQEGGAVQALSGPGFPELPSAVDQGLLPPPDLADLADGLGASLAAAGITVNLAPVVDVVPAGTESGNAPIGAHERQYGSTAADVVRAAGAVVDGQAAHGVTATLKHFPGLGRVTENTDVAVVTDTVTTRDDEQVAAFGTLAGSPAEPFVMTASAVYALIDPAAPAAFSPVVVTDVLREQLGFDGVVISDDLGAAVAVQDVPVGERAVRFLAAGGTLILTVDAGTVPEMVDAVLARDASDPSFADQVDAAVRTSLTAKASAGLLPPA